MNRERPFLSRRRFAGFGVAGVLSAAARPRSVSAQHFPNRPIRIVVGAAPGGGALDLVPRLIAEPMAEALGRPVLVENRPGAGGILAAEAVAQAPADGHTLLAGSTDTIVYSFVMAGRPPLDPFADFTPVARLTADHWLVVASPAVGAGTLAELVAAAKARPQGLNYATSGVGSSPHLQAERVRRRLGFEATHVPHRGDTISDLISGRLDFAVQPGGSVAPHVAAGRLRGLAVLSEARLPTLPEVPTVAEAGHPDLRYNAGVSLFTTGGTPEPAVARLNAAVNAALAMPAARARFAELALDTPQTTPEEAAAFVRRLLAMQDEMRVAVFGKAR